MNLIQKIKSVFSKISTINAIGNWDKRTPYGKWCGYYEISSFIGRTCLQLHCVFENKPIGPIGYLPGFFCFLNGFLLLYTTYYYISKGNFFKCVPSYCIFGAAVSTYSAYWCTILKTGMWPQLLAESKYIYRDDHEPSDYNRICYECLKHSGRQYFISILIVLLSSISACIGPIHTYFQEGTLVTLYELRIPFLENDPNLEFILSLFWQSITSILAVLAISLIEAGMALINNAITVSSKLNALSIYLLSKRLELNSLTDRMLRKKLQIIFSNILHWDKYVNIFKDLLYYRMFFAPPAFTFSIAISIYSQTVLKYPAGYGLAVVSYIQMAILCLVGQNYIDRVFDFNS